MYTMKTNHPNPHHHNLKKINDYDWKYKITATTSIESSHNHFLDENNLCGVFAKYIFKHQKIHNNNPLGFVSMEYTKYNIIHFHSIWSHLYDVVSLGQMLSECFNKHQYNSTNRRIRFIDHQISEYVPYIKYGSDWIGYILKSRYCDIYYTPSLVKRIKNVNKRIDKINKQSGLVDTNDYYLFRYINRSRIVDHNNCVLRKLETTF